SVANEASLGRKAGPAHSVVVVLPHASDVIRKRPGGGAARPVHVVGDNDVDERRHFDRRRIATGSGGSRVNFCDTLAKPRPRPVDRQPSVCKLAKLVEAAGRQSRDVNRHILAQRLEAELEATQPETFALVIDALARKQHPDDLDRLLQPGERLCIGDAVEVLDHTGATGSKAEPESPARNLVHSRRAHGYKSGTAAKDI